MSGGCAVCVCVCVCGRLTSEWGMCSFCVQIVQFHLAKFGGYI